MPITSILKPSEKVSRDDPRLFNVADLATAIGVPGSYIRRLKKCGFLMPLGRASVAMAHEFLRENPGITDAAETPASTPIQHS